MSLFVSFSRGVASNAQHKFINQWVSLAVSWQGRPLISRAEQSVGKTQVLIKQVFLLMMSNDISPLQFQPTLHD